MHVVIVAAVVLAFAACVLVDLVSALHYLIARPSRPILPFSESDDPIVMTFEACFLIFLFFAAVVMLSHELPRRAGLMIRDTGLRWHVRGNVEQLIPWEIIDGVALTSNGRQIELDLAFGTTMEIPRRVYRRLYAAPELHDLINTRLIHRRR